ncbi:uroporphyrinogen decarboxylase family protein [Mariniphaga sp.]|uniref:uroporphyrinogen decarboxylase family protein n=1 Tax=Mariniphaga sp. TaxID=1954475 RepID=UPI003564143D
MNKKTMTSRERILAAINHQIPDRIPVDLGSTPSSGISAIAYSNLVKHIGMPELPVQIYDVVQQLAQPDMKVLGKFGIDVLDIGREFNDKPSDWKPITLANGASAFYPKWFNPIKLDDGSFATYDDDGKTMLSRMPVGATFFDQTYFPYLDGYPDNYDNLDAEMGRIMWARDAHSPWDHAGDDGFWETLREKTLHLRQNTDKALLVVCGCNLFEWGTFLRRMDNFLMDLMCDHENVEKLLDELMKRHLVTLEKVCNAVGDIVDIIRFGDDLGMTQGPFMEPEIYRQLFKPRHKILCDYVKEHSQMHTFIHSCGSISLLMPDMIEAGIEIFNPVQTNAYLMEPAFLKKEFGNDCTFWGGGIENVGVLNNGTPQQVRDQVFERLEIFSEGGGFVFNTVHNILPDVPPENIVAMYNAIDEFNNKNQK